MNIGIDLVKIERIAKLMDNPPAMAKLFNPGEILSDPQRLAGCLAAKEAYFKACGRKGNWLELELGHEEGGAPFLLVRGKRDDGVRVSISHEGEYAAAAVMIQ